MKSWLLFGVMMAVSVLSGGSSRAASRQGSYGGTEGGRDLVDVDVLFVGAHPDDDGGIMETFARYILDQGFKGNVLTMTGGEGGGNATGREAGRALGLIRSEEERRALSLLGVDAPQFLGLRDFYFTLSAEEAARKWGDAFICEVVRQVRLRRPEVIVTMWPGPGTHGQHQMAARAATIAFDKAGDPAFCATQITEEFLDPFLPSKLYYYGRTGETSLSVPTADFSRTTYMRYADLKGLALSKYRSQGFDQFLEIPVKDARPEVFMLVRSRVPLEEPESHLLAGALLPAGASPPGVRLSVEPESFTMGMGVGARVKVLFANGTGSPFEDVELSLEAPPGWAAADQGALRFDRVEPGAEVESVFALRPSPEAVTDHEVRLRAAYAGRHEGRRLRGSNFTWIKAVPPVQVTFQPTYDVAGYREFARDTETEWVIENLPTRLPLVIGRRNQVTADVVNRSDRDARDTLQLGLPAGIRSVGGLGFEAPAARTTPVSLELEVDPSVLPAGRHAAKVPIEMAATVEGLRSVDVADAYALPSLGIPGVERRPLIDGDLADMESYARGEISPEDLWWRKAPSGPSDASAEFFLAYDESFLYAGVHVRDDIVVCNIAPDDIRAQLRSDAVGITVDPSGKSRDTSTTLQAAAFPCTTAGFEARGFRDADANQGLMEETAPGMEVASRRTSDGYDFEAAIPWSAMPGHPRPGDEIGLNIVIYDGDLANARVGANISESGLAWAAFSLGGKQALPYLWPRAVLEK